MTRRYPMIKLNLVECPRPNLPRKSSFSDWNVWEGIPILILCILLITPSFLSLFLGMNPGVMCVLPFEICTAAAIEGEANGRGSALQIFPISSVADVPLTWTHGESQHCIIASKV